MHLVSSTATFLSSRDHRRVLTPGSSSTSPLGSGRQALGFRGSRKSPDCAGEISPFPVWILTPGGTAGMQSCPWGQMSSAPPGCALPPGRAAGVCWEQEQAAPSNSGRRHSLRLSPRELQEIQGTHSNPALQTGHSWGLRPVSAEKVRPRPPCPYTRAKIKNLF